MHHNQSHARTDRLREALDLAPVDLQPRRHHQVVVTHLYMRGCMGLSVYGMDERSYGPLASPRTPSHIHNPLYLLPPRRRDRVGLGVERDDAVLDELAPRGDQGLLGPDALGAFLGVWGWWWCIMCIRLTTNPRT